MKLKYLGTGAAEGWPALFCSCESCKKARQLGGKNIRTRSQALVDNKLLIDLPPDTYMHYLQHGFPLPAITDILVTHSHSDHFYPKELEMRCRPYCDEHAVKLSIYGNRTVEALYREEVRHEPDIENFNCFVPVKPFQVYEVASYQVIPLKALHDSREECLIYCIKGQSKQLLYCHDTGIFPRETWDYLVWNKIKADAVSLDCTTGIEADGGNHMGVEDVISMKKDMIQRKIADENTVFVAAHFSHNGKLMHQELEDRFRAENIQVAYDGLEINI